jgi:cell wall-associated NlpC family hydrolase
MSIALLGSTTPRRRRLTSVLMAATFGLSLAISPVTAPTANATGGGISAAQGVRAVNIARLQRGIPYVWGGTTRRGFDCSGLTQYTFMQMGKRIPRVAQDQYRYAIRLRPHMQRPGDLVFFYSGATIYHVGIYTGNGWMINAAHSGTVVRYQRIWTSSVHYGRVR